LSFFTDNEVCWAQLYIINFQDSRTFLTILLGLITKICETKIDISQFYKSKTLWLWYLMYTIVSSLTYSSCLTQLLYYTIFSFKIRFSWVFSLKCLRIEFEFRINKTILKDFHTDPYLDINPITIHNILTYYVKVFTQYSLLYIIT